MIQGLRKGQVVVTEGSRSKLSLFSRAIARATRSWATHTWVVTGEDELVEAWFPQVRATSLSKRLKQLDRQDRAVVILDLPRLDETQRNKVAEKAGSYTGRLYNVLQAAWYGIFRDFLNDRHMKSLICSRLVTAAYFSGIGVNLFPDRIIEKHFKNSTRVGSLRRGYVTPADLLQCKLEIIDFIPSTRIKSPEELIST